MPGRMQPWEELISSDRGLGTLVVSMSGAFQWPRSFGFGDRRTIVVDRYERIGRMVAVTTWDVASGQRFGNVIACEADVRPGFLSSGGDDGDPSVPSIFMNELI